ncbi:MAG: amidohydrolase [candidate division KSB1 bacterium]|nr:amidohydrolase [candidate division KSB1 bacterium]MDZ7302498.1 amidohydrolase [candidate division KSB1 bacterium]
MKAIAKMLRATMVAGIIFTGFNLFAQNLKVAPNQLYHEIKSLANREYPSLEQLYKHLHANPELSLHEEKTSARIAEELRKTGFMVTTGIGKFGVVGVMKNGNGPTVLVRTDLDALPITENTGLEYASKVCVKDDQGNEVGVMHACGHDIHMTSFIGTARLLSQLKDKWRGTLVFIGQPAEERGGGARAMLADGLYTKFPKPDYCVAWHVAAEIPAGTVGYCEGYALANVNSVDLTIRGVGGHGAYPHTTKDPIVIAAQTIMALQTIVSREIKPIDPAVVTVGSIHGGTKHNIIPDEVHLQLTVRSYSDATKEQTLRAIERICKGIAIAAGVPEDRMPIMTVLDEFTPSTYNDPALMKKMTASMKAILGADKVITKEPVMGGEDFGEYGRTEHKIPIAIFWLGTVQPERVEHSLHGGEPLPSLHSSQFAPLPEPTIKTGVTAMTAAVLDLLGGK